jgi:hypothetical protein
MLKMPFYIVDSDICGSAGVTRNHRSVTLYIRLSGFKRDKQADEPDYYRIFPFDKPFENS